jgi:hypothetical protein
MNCIQLPLTHDDKCVVPPITSCFVATVKNLIQNKVHVVYLRLSGVNNVECCEFSSVSGNIAVAIFTLKKENAMVAEA